MVLIYFGQSFVFEKLHLWLQKEEKGQNVVLKFYYKKKKL